MGYWQTLFDPRFMFDNAYSLRRDIEADRGMAQVAELTGELALSRIAELEHRVHDLSVTVMALVQLLGEAHHVDPNVLRARVEQAVAAEAPAAGTLTCIRCRTQVPAAATIMTADGAVCDRCAG